MAIYSRTVNNKKNILGVPTYRPGKVYDVTFQYMDINNERKTYGKRAFATKAEAKRHEAEMIVKFSNSSYLEGYVLYRKAPLSKYLNDWVEGYAYNYLAPNTYGGYKTNITKHINPLIGNVILENVTATHIDRLCLIMLEIGYANSTVKSVYRTLSVSLEHARKHNYIDQNPVRNSFVKLPDDKDVPLPYTLAECRRLFLGCDDKQLLFIIMLAMCYGLRRGEIYGLKIDSIDIDNRCFYVREQLSSDAVYKRTRKYTSRPKSKAGIRTLPITETTLNYFVEQITLHEDRSSRFDDNYKDIGIIVCRDNGRPYCASHTARKYNKLLEKLNMRKISLRDLRRTAATNMHELTGDYFTVSEILGHSLKGTGIALGIAEALQYVTSLYISLRLERKLNVLNEYHKVLLDEVG